MEKNESRMNHRRTRDDSWTTRNYCTVKIPAALAEAIDTFLREEEAEMRGFRSRADVVVSVLVDFLESRGSLKPLVRKRFEHVNVYESHVLVRDNLLGVTVEVRLSPPKAYCMYCLSDGCPHVVYALSLEDVKASFVEHGLKPPSVDEPVNGFVVFVDGVAYPLFSD